jgi:hypothetical protein
MYSVAKEIDRVKISYDGYEFCYFIPEDFRNEHMKEWREANEKQIKKAKEDLKDEYREKSIELSQLAENSETDES